jgi:hypothetical protein
MDTLTVIYVFSQLSVDSCHLQSCFTFDWFNRLCDVSCLKHLARHGTPSLTETEGRMQRLLPAAEGPDLRIHLNCSTAL